MEHGHAWAEIDMGAAAENYRTLRALTAAKSKFCCVVKANAYGHGALPLSLLWQGLGADAFAVADIEEAEELRRGGISRPILILGCTSPEEAARISALALTQCVYSLSYARELNAAAKAQGVTLPVHIKLDSGMGRIGFRCGGEGDDSPLGAREVLSLPQLSVRGVFTHFAVADEGEAGRAYTQEQYRAFTDAASYLEGAAGRVLTRHCANSAALLSYPSTHCDMVRCGIALLGVNPTVQAAAPPRLRPVMRLKTTVIHCKQMRRGESIGYGRSYVLPCDKSIATLPVGYADGVARSWAAGGVEVAVRGVLCPLVGRVSMDQCTVDVSGVPDLRIGEEAVLFGGADSLSAPEIARRAGTIPYEVFCGIGRRVKRLQTGGA